MHVNTEICIEIHIYIYKHTHAHQYSFKRRLFIAYGFETESGSVSAPERLTGPKLRHYVANASSWKNCQFGSKRERVGV